MTTTYYRKKLAARRKVEAARTDDGGNVLNEGDEVCVTYVDRSRGAELWMRRGVVVGFGRTRVRVHFNDRTTPFYPVGAECLRLVS